MQYFLILLYLVWGEVWEELSSQEIRDLQRGFREK